MKGIIFTQLVAMAEDSGGKEAVDRVIAASDLPTGGAYTSVGNYCCEEPFGLIGGLSEHSGLPAATLQRLFGHWLMHSFARRSPSFFEARAGNLDTLEAIEDDIHAELRKAYPDAELPLAETRRDGADDFDLIYCSPRPLADFCHGLIDRRAAYFGEKACIARGDASSDGQTVATLRVETSPSPSPNPSP